jgi:hypothetical protein
MGAEAAEGEVVEYLRYPEPPAAEGEDMEFRLTYSGALPSQQGNSRAKEKNEIRRVFHGQLKELWARHPVLKLMVPVQEHPDTGEPVRRYDQIARFKVGNKTGHIYNFLPLIGEEYGISCSLDILLLRRDMPGGVVKRGGDIDNRLKVLFDAMRYPQAVAEMPDGPPLADENPFYCVMQDDRFIDQFTITTDRLLCPPASDQRVKDVLLIIKIKTLVFDATKTPSGIFH